MTTVTMSLTVVSKIKVFNLVLIFNFQQNPRRGLLGPENPWSTFRSVRVGRPGPLLPPVTGRAPLAHQPGGAGEQEPVPGPATPGGLRGDPTRTLDPPERRTFWYRHTHTHRDGPQRPLSACWFRTKVDSVFCSHPPGGGRHVGGRRRPSRCLPHHPAALPLGRPRHQRLGAHGRATQIPDGGRVGSAGGSANPNPPPPPSPASPHLPSLSRCTSST